MPLVIINLMIEYVNQCEGFMIGLGMDLKHEVQSSLCDLAIV